MSVNNELLAIYYICEDWTAALPVYCSGVSVDLGASIKKIKTVKQIKTAVICYLRILHLLRIILSLGCKVFISVSPRMQKYYKLVIKNSVQDS